VTVAVAVVGAALFTLFSSSPARAQAPTRVLAATCPTDYTHATTPCTSSTTAALSLTLTISYNAGVVKWQGCGYPAAAVGLSETLYLDVAGVSISLGAGVIETNGCTSDPIAALCLAPSTYAATGLVQGYPNATATLTVTTAGCATPQGSASAGSGTGTGTGSSAGTATGTEAASSSGGTLAFTGSNVFRLVVVAAILILLGYAVTRLNRRRRHAR
jgi:hypothetical protein